MIKVIRLRQLPIIQIKKITQITGYTFWAPIGLSVVLRSRNSLAKIIQSITQLSIKNAALRGTTAHPGCTVTPVLSFFLQPFFKVWIKDLFKTGLQKMRNYLNNDFND